MKRHFDIAVIGSGFAGSLMAMVARRLGLSVVLIEKGRHPRVVIGESTTPLSNLLLEELAERYDLVFLKPLTKWGSWQKTYPHLACGLKRGFSFFHHALPGTEDVMSRQDARFLVAASPHDSIADTHWFRAHLDTYLAGKASELGVEFLDAFQVEGCLRENREWLLKGTRSSRPVEVSAHFLVDATGPRGFLHRMLGLAESEVPGGPTSALYSHFTGMRRFADGNACGIEVLPFPVDDAAVHHVFDGGWIWVLRFNNGWTSAGVAASETVAARFRLAEGQAAWQRLLKSLPAVQDQFQDAVPVQPFTHVPKLGFLSSAIAGDGWALLPGTAGFIDPLFSTGFPLSLLGILRIADTLKSQWNSPALATSLRAYASDTRNELLATGELMNALYRNMDDFAFFRSLSMLYFAAASYAETARRLDKPSLASGFLLCNDAVFALEFQRLLRAAGHQPGEHEKLQIEKDIYRLVDRFDVAGLCKRPIDHVYPVDAADLYASAHKLGASRSDIDALLVRSGFYKPSIEADAVNVGMPGQSGRSA